ncbi:hypothetical protein P9112_007679 [Eukaryota sp. TZLM1-RC]
MRNKVSSITSLFINDRIPLLLPTTKREKYSKFDFSSKSNLYLGAMFYINNYLEYEESKFFHALPLTNSCIPSYIRIDKTSLLDLFFAQFKDILGPRFFYQCNNQAADLFLWNTSLKMDKIQNTKLYSENSKYRMSSIETDGIAVSFIQSRMDLKKYKVTAKELKDKEKYIDDPNINPSEFQDRTLAATDPGKSDLLCISANLATGMTHSKKPERDQYVHFRYTQNQRRFESKSSKSKKIRDIIRNDTLITLSNSTDRVIDLSKYEPSEEKQQRMDLNSSIINQMTERTISLLRGKVPQESNIPHEIDYSFNLRNNEQKTKSVAEWETTLSQFNSKRCRFDRFMAYIKQKNFVNSIVGEVYHQK